MLRVLAVASHPELAAATRFRVSQLARRPEFAGIQVEVSSFLDDADFARLYHSDSLMGAIGAVGRGIGRRIVDLAWLGRPDVVLVQREAALLGPPLFEALARRRSPVVLDLDDATWVPYDSPTYGRLARVLKWPGKTEWLIRHSTMVTCGNRFILDHVRSMGAEGRLVPTVVDTDRFLPGAGNRVGLPVVGWIGTHSTFPYLQSVLPALASVASRHPFRLLVVGAGTAALDIPGVEVCMRPWALEREVEDFQSIDIGLYPLVDDGWARGKSGFKAIQYMAVGIPYVATPLGATRDIGEPGTTHLEASSPPEWEESLERLLGDADLRQRMGRAGRACVEARFSLADVANTMAAALREAAASRSTGPLA